MSYLNAAEFNPSDKRKFHAGTGDHLLSKSEALLAGKRCMVLEDELLIALDLEDVLERAGAASVACFSKATETLAALDAGTFDFALLDINLGGGAHNSFSVADALAERKIPFLFLTGMRHDAPQMSVYQSVPTLEKPYQQTALMDAIRSLLTPK
jgi:DNA-binding response OmpR family regulator